ncbi:hypothetical protein [Cupriavidus necator]|uniref:hypothetical protein n=1 Tax=Cupriavidus necator TaxID=106590 RepID=UPI00339D4991
MSRTLISRGVSNLFAHREQDGKIAFESVQDVEPVIERAKALHNGGFNRTKMGDRHVASIPIIVLDAWAKKQGKSFRDVMQDQRLMTRFLQDPDHSHFVIDKASVR